MYKQVTHCPATQCSKFESDHKLQHLKSSRYSTYFYSYKTGKYKLFPVKTQSSDSAHLISFRALQFSAI